MAATEEIEALIAAVAAGDRRAFESLYAATSAKLYGVALRILQDRAEADDVLQEACLRTWNNAHRYVATGLSPMTWLITIARNLAIDRVRARPRRRPTARCSSGRSRRERTPCRSPSCRRTRTELVVPEPLRSGLPEATLAVSDEPAGGSPTGQPTGPVVAVGGITRL